MVRGRRVRVRRVCAVRRGRVQPEYFAGARVRFFSESRRVQGTIASVQTAGGHLGRRRFFCLVLGNYHNMNCKRERIGVEFVNLGEFEKLIQSFVALATTKCRYGSGDPELLAMLNRLGRELSPQLRRTVDHV